MKLGKAFSDSLIVEQKRIRHVSVDKPDSWWLGRGRALFFASGFLVAFFILVWRLFELTVVQGRSMRALADNNRTRDLVRHAPRGNLLDRTGKPLTTNIPEYRLTKPCEREKEIELCIQRLSQEEGEQLAKEGLPDGWYLEQDYLRQYPYGEALAHAVGYVGEITESELNDDYYALRNYHPGDRLGRMGAEAVLEERLRGRDGRELVEVDAKGKIIRSLGRQEEAPGEDVSLSLDAGISQAAAKAFPAGLKGAVVVTKPLTGEILALFSSPSFSPNAFSFSMTTSQYQLLVDNPDTPMFNRVIGGVYPPGSTFKIVTAVAALEEKAITPETTVEDIGVITIGPFTFPNWYFIQYGKTEGMVSLVRAIQRSNDIFFYKTGEWLGITKLAEWAKKFGIGKTLGIELSGEAAGLMPDPGWKNANFTTRADLEGRNNEWYLGDTYHVAIGQGYLLTTPLQVNAWTNVIANNGKLCKPTIKKAISDKREAKSNCKDLNIKKETIELITEGMRRACDTGGTGWPLFGFSVIPASHEAAGQAPAGIQPSDDPTGSRVGARDDNSKVSIPVACKTGTAEFGDPNDRTHAWFTVFGPIPVPDTGNQAVKLDHAFEPDTGNQSIKRDQIISGEPEISITVLVEGAGEGSSVAAPIAKKILEEWFGR